MSRPPNILSEYRSHSFYHVLALCDRSATADALAASEDANVWVREHDNSSGSYGKWTPQKTHDTDDGEPGIYSIIMHGAEDADMCIDSYKVTSYTAANATGSDKSTSIATEGELTITEPKGVIFFDLLVSLMNEMGSDATTCCFVLKTFFVGHGYSDVGEEYSSTISDVAPVMFLLTDATAAYTEAGGVYTLQFVALANGSSRLPQYSKAADGASVHLDKAANSRATVKQALEALFDVIRQNYRHHYDCVIAVANQKKVPSPEKSFFKVDYEIKVEEPYDSDEYIVTDAPMQFKTHGGDCAAPPAIKNKPGASIEDAIHRIMNMCPKVQQDMVDGDGGGENAIKYEYKIHSTARTHYDGDEKRCVVTYVVKRFVSPRGFNFEKLLRDNPTTEEAMTIRENLIEFDYLFSGKNVDVLEFNIQMNYGLSYLQMATTANSFKDQFEAVASRTRHISMHSDEAGRFGGKDPDNPENPIPIPVFFAPQLRGLTSTNTNDPSGTVPASYNMAKHGSLEMAEATVKIVGNPRIYSSVAGTSHPNNVGKEIKPGASQPGNDATLEDGDFRHWTHAPALAKVNIYMPAQNDDIGLMSGMGEGPDDIPPDFAKKFWYDGYYYVYGVENNFDNGEFTQQLLMLAMPNGALLENGSLKAEAETSAKSVSQCYDSMIASNPATAKATTPTVPHAPDEKKADVQPTNKQDADSMNAAVGDPSKVKGWSKADPAVQAAINEASSRTGVDASLLAQFAYLESSFKPTAKAKTSSATGLYQHINGTWMGLVKDNKIPTIPANTPRDEALALRTDPLHSAMGGAAYVQQNAKSIKSTNPGDLYLAHFAGPGSAKAVIAACNSGKGGASLEETLGFKRATAMKNANPSIRNLDTNGLRAWAATKMAGTLVSGVPVAQSVAVPPPPTGTGAVPKAKAPVTDVPVKGKTAAEVVAENTGKTVTEKTEQKKDCGTKEPDQQLEAVGVGVPTEDATKQPAKT
jgi:Transglycosylase SLT domain